MATLNIGLAVNGGGRIGVGEALAAIRTIGGEEPVSYAIHDSDSEPTLVAETRRPLWTASLFELARKLRQDAVAQWDGHDGQLVGPNAAAWGLFNPAFFLTLDGGRLGTSGLRLAA